jgi:5-methylcytosine-specific restriction endonuclease McrA
MSSLIHEELRRMVARRADQLCEYCLLHEDDGLLDFQVDHIISRKHGGAAELGNLAFACPFCNRQKGSDTNSGSSGKLVSERRF